MQPPPTADCRLPLSITAAPGPRSAAFDPLVSNLFLFPFLFSVLSAIYFLHCCRHFTLYCRGENAVFGLGSIFTSAACAQVASECAARSREMLMRPLIAMFDCRRRRSCDPRHSQPTSMAKFVICWQRNAIALHYSRFAFLFSSARRNARLLRAAREPPATIGQPPMFI